MKNRESREKRLKRINEKLSRRDFAKRTVLLSVASNMAARSVPAFASGIPMDQLKGANGVGDNCYTFLVKLGPHYSMYDLLFGDFRKVISQLRLGYPPVGRVGGRLEALNLHLKKFEDEPSPGFYRPTLAELFAYEDGPPSGEVHPSDWHKIARICDYIKGDISIPFLGMSRADRINLRNLFITDTTFRDVFADTRRFPYRELFTRGRDVVFPQWNTAGSDDELRYNLVRNAFRMGAFRHKTVEMEIEHYNLQGMPEDQIKHKVVPNGHCWDDAAGDCVADCNLYCQEDPPNGPTPASDGCDDCP